MPIFFGWYRFAPKLVAFRNDWCTQCHGEHLTFGRRTIDFGHFFWIPILPLGVWTRWYCSNCNMDPAESAETKRPVRILTWLLVAPIAVIAAIPVYKNDPTVQGGFTLFVLVAAAGAFLFVSWWAFKSLGDTHDTRRARVQPYASDECPLCSGTIMTSMPKKECSSCGAEHRPLEKANEVLGPVS